MIVIRQAHKDLGSSVNSTVGNILVGSWVAARGPQGRQPIHACPR